MIRAKKSLGQNFLIDKKIINKIVNTVNIQNKTILEIGPGTGNLTSSILVQKPKKVFVIEKDNALANQLRLTFKDKITVFNEDILKFNEASLSKDKLIVFGNLPYNISTEILTKWILGFDENCWFDHLILMFQKEVADRINAKFNTSNYGRLSILSDWKLKVKKKFDIDPASFSPRPKIESSLLFFTPKKDFYNINSKNLEFITRIFFNHRRKMLKKPYNQIFNGNKIILDKLKIDLTLRPQNLDTETYFKITKEYENLQS
ncbi:16S rRNA (adenine(1518)-N(6)/adenine(1519)-N(6))-dimethyltransferase RsmA [Candidatus Pelagibacter sp. HIMB1715]|uniref:16S rRNA (adenine(1518)-N(6)/adenine(1519)-N(6))- dimethyltransferase RsmA n=1 Tax=Candidatus Pelagibacter sp. HIMB1715 TaxID=3413369 RepID=UPI003F85FC05